MTQKLSQRARWLRSGVAQLESSAQHGWAAKADFLIGAFLPDFEHGSGFDDCEDGGGHCPELKDNGPTPLGRLSRFRQPGLATLNSTEKGQP